MISFHIQTGLLDVLSVHSFHVEAVALLSKLDSKKYISVELSIDEVNLTSAESKATYAQIKEYQGIYIGKI